MSPHTANSSQAASANIVHEADAQRQYVRVPLPAYIHLNGHIHTMSNWSVKGATVQLDKGENTFRAGQSFPALLIFKMEGFGLQVPVQASIRHVDQAKKHMGVTFEDISSRQLSILQQLVSAYISGELTSAEDILHIVERNNFVKTRSIPPSETASLPEQTALLIRKAVIFGIGVLLLGFLLLSIYERNFLVEARNAFVDAGSFMVNTPAGGIVLYTDIDQGTPVKQGSPLAVVQSRTGTVATIESPCDCIVHQKLVAHGNQVNQGESIVTLVPNGASMYITAYIPYEKAKDLHKGQTAHIALAGSRRLNGKVQHISNAAWTKDDYQLRIVSEKPINPSFLGAPAHVTIDTLR